MFLDLVKARPNHVKSLVGRLGYEWWHEFTLLQRLHLCIRQNVVLDVGSDQFIIVCSVCECLLGVGYCASSNLLFDPISHRLFGLHIIQIVDLHPVNGRHTHAIVSACDEAKVESGWAIIVVSIQIALLSPATLTLVLHAAYFFALFSVSEILFCQIVEGHSQLSHLAVYFLGFVDQHLNNTSILLRRFNQMTIAAAKADVLHFLLPLTNERVLGKNTTLLLLPILQ